MIMPWKMPARQGRDVDRSAAGAGGIDGLIPDPVRRETE